MSSIFHFLFWHTLKQKFNLIKKYSFFLQQYLEKILVKKYEKNFF